jgi:hypothetical protein
MTAIPARPITEFTALSAVCTQLRTSRTAMTPPTKFLRRLGFTVIFIRQSGGRWWGSKENARSLVPRGRAVGCDVKQRWRRGGIRTQKSTTGLDGPFQPTSARQLGLIPCGPIRLRRLSPTILYCTPHLLSFVLPAGRSPLLALRLAPPSARAGLRPALPAPPSPALLSKCRCQRLRTRARSRGGGQLANRCAARAQQVRRCLKLTRLDLGTS